MAGLAGQIFRAAQHRIIQKYVETVRMLVYSPWRIVCNIKKTALTLMFKARSTRLPVGIEPGFLRLDFIR